MSTLKVTVEELVISEHPNADALELAQVGLYRAVVPKGVYKTGDYAVYIPEQAVLPATLIEELGLTGKLAGPKKDRIKAIRLRGLLSQGIVCRPKELENFWWIETEHPEQGYLKKLAEDGEDWSVTLGITKWEPPVPVGMTGDVEGSTRLIRWPDIENIKRRPDMFEPGEEVVATEKIHGTNCQVVYVRATDEVMVTSKGLGSRNLVLKPSQTNLYWRAAWKHKLPLLVREIASYYDADRVALFGEVYGAGVQDLHYGSNAGHDDSIGYALFDIATDHNGQVKFIDATVADLAVAHLPDPVLSEIPWAPVLYRGPYDYEQLAALAEGMEQVSGGEIHLREGIVVRPAHERHGPDGRVIAKFVAESYLTRTGDVTEFE